MSAANTEHGHVPKPAPWPPAPPGTARTDHWPNRSADVRTIHAIADGDWICPASAADGVRAGVTPPDLAALDDPAQIRALQTAHHMGFLEGQATSDQDEYTAGWRFGVVCGAVAAGLLFCSFMELGYLVGLAR